MLVVDRQDPNNLAGRLMDRIDAFPMGADETAARAVVAPVRSVFHQPWYLDIATDGHWAEAAVQQDGVTVGLWPYPTNRRHGLPVSTMPSLIRTLGPLVSMLPGKPAAVLRRRSEIVHALLDQLPHFDDFEQLFDPCVEDGLPYLFRDFVVNVGYCFRLPAGRSLDSLWYGMLDKTRNVIRKADSSLRVGRIADPQEFCRFHDTNLGDQPNRHGAQRMHRLIAACLEQDCAAILGARDAAGVLQAAVVFVWDAATCCYFLATRDHRTALAGAVSLLIWHGMQLAHARGLAFDFDGAVTPGMAAFLSGFGGTLTPRLRVRRVTMRYRLLHGAARLLPLPLRARRIA